MKNILILFSVFCTSVSFSHPHPADSKVETEIENPSRSRFGLYGTVLGDPGVNIVGINLAYQLDDNWRGVVGYGSYFTLANSVGVAAHYYFRSESRFRAFTGLGFTNIFVNSMSFIFDSTIPAQSVFLTNLKLGVEYQAPSGFFVSLHINGIYIPQREIQAVGLDPIPSLSIGSFL